MRPTISIDLGAAYTKIAIRREPDSVSNLLSHEKFRLDDLHVCIPTIAAWRRSDDRWVFGDDAQDLVPSDDIYVFRNWKPLLFTPPEESLDPNSALGRMFYQSLHSATVHCKVENLAAGYFRWLLREMLPYMIGDQPCTDPVLRISVPDFAEDLDYDCEIEQILQKAGWNSPRVRTAPEPVTNLIGALSDGKNYMRDDNPNLADTGKILAESGLTLAPSQEEPFHILSVDIGAYTTDFAVFEIKDGFGTTLPPCRSQSAPFGIEMLDNLVKHGLAPRKGDLLGTLSSLDRESFRRCVYTEERTWSCNEQTFGEGNEMPIIEKCINGMSTRISNEVDEFLSACDVSRLDVAIFTGGGSNIPRITRNLANRLASKQVTTFLSSSLPENFPGARRLSQSVIRGASAIGGASVIFGEN